MKALRYLLMMIAVMGVLSISAQAPQYGKPYKPVYKHARYSAASVETQAPTATIGSVNSGYVQSGSALPQAAVTGTSTTYDRHNAPGGPRRAASDEDEGDTPPDDPHGPMEDPIGDAGWPLAMCALAYVCVRAFLKRKRA